MHVRRKPPDAGPLFLADKNPRRICGRGLFFAIRLCAFHFVAFQATGAHVGGFHLSFFHDFDFLHVCLKSPSRFSVAVADVVSRILPLIADDTNSRHIFDLHGSKFRYDRAPRGIEKKALLPSEQ